MISGKHTRHIRRVIQFGLIWLISGIVYSLVEKGLMGSIDHYPSTGNPYNFKESIIVNSIATFVMGVFQGAIEFYFLNRFFIRRSLLSKIARKTFINISIIVFFVICLNSIYNSRVLGVPIFSEQILMVNIAFINSFSFFGVIIFVSCIVTLCLLFSEITDYIGMHALTNFLYGKYHRAKTEERIFMFLDMKSSTTIAETLGHARYFKLLNKYYSDMTSSILGSFGEIYQYAGDNIIITWKLKNGLKNNNCVRCYFDIRETLKTQSWKYAEGFKLIPEFKAAIHCGTVATGEIGVIKKEIMFTGDVLNTTDRIQKLCKEYNVDLLISEELLSKLKIENGYQPDEIGLCELKGKGEKVKLFTLSKNTQQ